MALTQTAGQLIPDLAPKQRQLLIVGVVAILVSLLALFTNAPQFLRAYLVGYMYCLALTLGCLVLQMVHQLSGGAWGVVTRRLSGAASRLMPLMTVLFVPIALGLHQLYPWTDPARVAADEVLRHNQAWMNIPFFLIRAVTYFAAWNAMAYAMSRWSRQQDRTNDPIYADWMARLSGGGIVLYGITITFASIDWLMSLEPDWFSTIYGLLIIAGQGLLALSFLITVLVWLGRREPMRHVLAPVHFHDLSNLMLAFTMLWAYMSFSQLLIIWAGNLPREIMWYTHRLQTSWRYVGVFLIIFHFFVPFMLLLMRAIKRVPDLIVLVAGGMMIARIVDFWWLVLPSFNRSGIAISWVDVVLPLGLIAFWSGCFVWQLRAWPLLPLHDPQFDAALARIGAGTPAPRTAH